MFNNRKKIIIEYEKVKDVYVPVAVRAKGLQLRDVSTICRRFLHESNYLLKKEISYKIKEIKENKSIKRPGKGMLIKLLKDVDTPSFVIEAVEKEYTK